MFWEKTASDPVALFTFVLAVSTIGLGIATVLLYKVAANTAKRQASDTEIIQRAYIAVEPGGFAPFQDRPDRALCSVILRNVGHLPARNVRWYGGVRGYGSDRDFPIGELIEGSIVLPPGAKTVQGIGILFIEDFSNFAFVWGKVTYEDGFGNMRFTKFCHRYWTKHLLGGQTCDIAGEEAILHEYGNDAN